MSRLEHHVVARVMLEANRALCSAHGDASHLSWNDTDAEAREHFVRGIEAVLRNPEMTAKEGHDFWVADHVARGWTWGEAKDRAAKTHPCMVPFEELSPLEQAKDRLFIAIVRALLLEN